MPHRRSRGGAQRGQSQWTYIVPYPLSPMKPKWHWAGEISATSLLPLMCESSLPSSPILPLSLYARADGQRAGLDLHQAYLNLGQIYTSSVEDEAVVARSMTMGVEWCWLVATGDRRGQAGQEIQRHPLLRVHDERHHEGSVLARWACWHLFCFNWFTLCV